jgi:hypothetical protein
MSTQAQIVRDDNVSGIGYTNAVILVDNGIVPYADTPSQSRQSVEIDGTYVRNGDIGRVENVKSVSIFG